MPFDVGDSVPIAWDVKDSTGALTNAGTVTLTVTLPDGTTANPSVTNPPASTGQYRVTYVPAVAGRFTWYVVTTAPNTAIADTFEVRQATSPALVSLADAKNHLNIPATSTTSDDELREFLEAVTKVVERFTGPIVRRTHTARMCGGVQSWVLPHTQVQSITSITRVRDGSTTAITISDLTINAAAGIVSYKNGNYLPAWDYDVVYVVGRTYVESNWTLAAKHIIQNNWRSQLGNLPSIQGDEEFDPDSGFLIPRTARSLLDADYAPLGFA